MFELNYTINMVYEQRTRRLVPAAWSQKDLPHQLKNITFLKIESKEGSVFAKSLQEILGMKVTMFTWAEGGLCVGLHCVCWEVSTHNAVKCLYPVHLVELGQIKELSDIHMQAHTHRGREGGGRWREGESKSERRRNGGWEGGVEGGWDRRVEGGREGGTEWQRDEGEKRES